MTPDPANPRAPDTQPAGAGGPLFPVLRVRPGEGPAVVLSGVFFFVLLLGSFLIRPAREAMGVQRSMGDDAKVWSGRVFDVWLSGISVFMVSVFWACMATTGGLVLDAAISPSPLDAMQGRGAGT